MSIYDKKMQWQFGSTIIEFLCYSINFKDGSKVGPILGIRYGHSDIIKRLKDQIIISCSQKETSPRVQNMDNLDLIIDENEGKILGTDKESFKGVHEISDTFIKIRYANQADNEHNEDIFIDRKTGTLIRKIRERVKILDNYKDIEIDIRGECKKVENRKQF